MVAYVPEALDTFDMLTREPLISKTTGEQWELNNEQRLTVLLHMWIRYDPASPN